MIELNNISNIETLSYCASVSENIKVYTNNILSNNILKIETLIDIDNDQKNYSVFFENAISPTSITTLTDELLSIDVELPDYECLAIITFNGEIVFCNVQLETSSVLENSFFYILNDLNIDQVSYNSIDPLGVALESGQFTKINTEHTGNLNDHNIFYYDLNDASDYQILEVNGEIFNLTPLNGLGNIQELMSGEYIIQPNRFQMIAIPKKDETVEYFLNLVQQQMGLDSSFDNKTIKDVINLTKAYPSNDNSFNKYQVYVPTVSNDAAKFNLLQNDNGKLEIVPFFIKTGSFDNNITIKWDNKDL